MSPQSIASWGNPDIYLAKQLKRVMPATWRSCLIPSRQFSCTRLGLCSSLILVRSDLPVSTRLWPRLTPARTQQELKTVAPNTQRLHCDVHVHVYLEIPCIPRSKKSIRLRLFDTNGVSISGNVMFYYLSSFPQLVLSLQTFNQMKTAGVYSIVWEAAHMFLIDGS